MKNAVAVLTVAGVLMNAAFCLSGYAQESNKTEGTKIEKEKPAPTELTLTGQITKEERQGREGKTNTHYILTDTAGNKVFLPGEGRRHEDKPATSVSLEEYVNKNVTITAQGYKREKDGKSRTRLVSITKIEAVPATPAGQ